MSTLYDITRDYLCLLEMMEDGGDMNPQVLRDTLEGIEGEFEEKADECAKIIRELDAEADKFKAEIERMTVKANIINGNSARLKQYLYDNMKAAGKTKFKTNLFSFGIRKNGGLQPLEIIPDVEIPDEYCNKKPDNSKIREALKNGAELPFAALKERGEHLSIR